MSVDLDFAGAAQLGQDITQPHSLDAERELLSAIVYRPEQALTVADERGVTEADFYQPKHAHWYRAFRALEAEGSAVDVVLALEWLRAQGLEEAAGGRWMLAALMEHGGVPAHAADYCQVVLERSERRKVITASQDAIAAAYDLTLDLGEVRDRAEKALLGSWREDRRESLQSGQRAVEEAMSPVIQSRRLPTGIGDLDGAVGGLPTGGGGLTVVCGRPGMGKSALVTDLLIACLGRGGKALIVSAEMSRAQYLRRCLGSLTGTSVQRVDEALDSGRVTAELTGAADWLHRGVWAIDDASGPSADYVRRRAKTCAARWHGIDLLVVDYLQLMHHAKRYGERMDQAMGASVETLRRLQRDLDCAVVVVSQLNREVERRDDQRPRLADIRECGAMEEAAGLALGLYRPAVARKGTDEAEAEIVVMKHRGGRTGRVSVRWNGTRMSFAERGVL